MAAKSSADSEKSKTAKINSVQRGRIRKYGLPVAITAVGFGLIAVSLYFLLREAEKLVDDISYDVENYDVVQNKPFIFN